MSSPRANVESFYKNTYEPHSPCWAKAEQVDRNNNRCDLIKRGLVFENMWYDRNFNELGEWRQLFQVRNPCCGCNVWIVRPGMTARSK